MATEKGNVPPAICFHLWGGATAQGYRGKAVPLNRGNRVGRCARWAGEVRAAPHLEEVEEEVQAVIIVANIAEFSLLYRCCSQLFPCIFLLKTRNSPMKWFK